MNPFFRKFKWIFLALFLVSLIPIGFKLYYSALDMGIINMGFKFYHSALDRVSLHKDQILETSLMNLEIHELTLPKTPHNGIRRGHDKYKWKCH